MCLGSRRFDVALLLRGMLRVLLSTPSRLAFGGVPCSFSVLVVPIASASARLVARPFASSFCRFSGFTLLRALSA